MLGSAAQNVIALSDGLFLYYYSEVYNIGTTEFAAIGFVGVFYLIVASIGYGFSKGGQIMVARRAGEGDDEGVGKTFYSMAYFELAMALGMFVLLMFVVPTFFGIFVNSESILAQSLDYLSYRSWGVFFSYLGVSIIALYTGVARTNFIIIDTLLLGAVNIGLNYMLIFGVGPFPEMGIGGAGLASTIAEVVAFVVFVVYILFDKKIHRYFLFEAPRAKVEQLIDETGELVRSFRLPKVDREIIRRMFNIASPIVAQSVVGLGSSFMFFSMVENLGEQELAISNLMRMIYLFLSVPIWGLCAGINTLSSNFIGQDKGYLVMPLAAKTAKLSVAITVLLALPVILFPGHILYPIFGSEEMTLIREGRDIFYILGGIMATYALGAVYFNALVSTGATFTGLTIQASSVVVYVIVVYAAVNITGSLELAWASEIVYWLCMLGITYWYLYSDRWVKYTGRV